jgi:hypothetical protein
MLLCIAHLERSQAGTYYELWLMTDPPHLTPAAALRVPNSGEASLSLRPSDNAHHYRYLDISRQRVDSGTSHSGDSIHRGRST